MSKSYNIINRENYEAFLLDYSEGNLSSQEIEMLKDFLEVNADLLEGLEFLEELKLEPISDKQDFSYLRMVDFEYDPVTSENVGDFSIAYFENDLSAEKENELKQFVKNNPAASEEFELTSKLKLKENRSISYPDIESLKKGRVIPLYVQRMVGVAAVLLLVAMGYFWLSMEKGDQKFNQGIAVNNPSQIKKEEPSPETEVNNKELEESNTEELRVEPASTESVPEKEKEITQDVYNKAPIIKKENKGDNDGVSTEEKLELVEHEENQVAENENKNQYVDKSDRQPIILSESRGLIALEVNSSKKMIDRTIPVSTVKPVPVNTTEKQQEENKDGFLNFKQLLVKFTKRKVLKSDDPDFDKIKRTDFNPSLARVTNGKAAFQETGGKAALVFRDAKVALGKKNQ